MNKDFGATLSGMAVWSVSWVMDISQQFEKIETLEMINTAVGFIAAVFTIWAALRTMKAKKEATKTEKLEQEYLKNKIKLQNKS